MVAKLQESQSHQALTNRAGETKLIRGRDGRLHSLADIIAAAEVLAQRLPDTAYVVNRCESRSGFFIGLIAAMLAEKPTLMPPNRQAGTLARLQQSAGRLALISDQAASALEQEYPTVYTKLTSSQAAGQSAAIPNLPLDQLSIIAYTSGSTGESTANPKPWHTLWQGAQINRAELLHGLPDELELLATVPSQHMYGFETAVMLPLASNIVLHDTQPLYPADIADALQQMSAPRVLVSTPVHLRALLRSGVTLPSISRIISATAPLELRLAGACEDTWQTEVLDTYGCSEAGCIARRRLSQGEIWRLFSAFKLKQGEQALEADAAHLPEAVPLPDQIEILDETHFRLLGRSADLINVAGKRASLSAINQALMAVPGVEDGVVFVDDSQTERLSAMVVAPSLDAEAINRQLRNTVDPVMLPRPIVFTDQLPRNETGKLPRQALLEAWHQARED